MSMEFSSRQTARRFVSQLRIRVGRKWFAVFVAAASLLLVPYSAPAATDTWDSSGTTVDWGTTVNWTSALPGSADTALFNSASNTTSITLTTLGTPAVFNLGSLSFDTAAASYTIGTTGGDAFGLTSGGTIQILSTLTATNDVETINAPLVIEGAGATYTFQNNSANGTGAGAGTLDFGGGITGGTAGATVLTLAGSNTNANTISGVIANGTATSVAINESGAGYWVLSGSSANTYTGGTTVTSGALILSKTAGVAAVPGNLAINGGASNLGNVWATANNQLGGANTIVSSVNATGIASFTLLGTTQTLAGLSSPGGGLMVANSTTSSGTPSPNNAGTGTLILTGSGSYTDAGWVWNNWGGSGTLALTLNMGSGGVQTLADDEHHLLGSDHHQLRPVNPEQYHGLQLADDDQLWNQAVVERHCHRAKQQHGRHYRSQ